MEVVEHIRCLLYDADGIRQLLDDGLTTDLKSTLGSVREMYTERLKCLSVQYIAQLPDEKCVALASLGEVVTVFSELFENAYRHGFTDIAKDGRKLMVDLRFHSVPTGMEARKSIDCLDVSFLTPSRARSHQRHDGLSEAARTCRHLGGVLDFQDVLVSEGDWYNAGYRTRLTVRLPVASRRRRR